MTPAIRPPDGHLAGSRQFHILALVLGGTLNQYNASEEMVLEPVNEAEAIPTNAWCCGWESWPT
jgi:hypothetical protein